MNSQGRHQAPRAAAHPDEQSADALLKMRGVMPVQGFEHMPSGGYHIAWSPDGTFLAAVGKNGMVAVWPEAAAPPWLLRGHDQDEQGAEEEEEEEEEEEYDDDTDTDVLGLAWHPRGTILATASEDRTVRVWDVNRATSQIFCRLQLKARGVGWSPDGSRLALTDEDGGISVWNMETGAMLMRAKAHENAVSRPCWTPDGRVLVTGSCDRTISIQTSEDLRLLHRLRGHSGYVFDIALSPDSNLIASASADGSVRVWDLNTGAEKVVLEGQRGSVGCVRFSLNGEFLAVQTDVDVRIWRCRDWECVSIVPQPSGSGLGGLDFHPSEPVLAAKRSGSISCYRIDYDLLRHAEARPGSRRYVNAKVVLLGDTGVGKSGLGLVLSGKPYQPTDSTHGRNVWTFAAYDTEASNGVSQTREILLWDLAGQPGYRLVHQLHLNEVAVALVVFDSRSEADPFSGVKHWVRALAQARMLEGSAAVPVRSYLVAARADRGGIPVSEERVQAMIGDLRLDGYFETSAKEGWQIADLSQTIRDGIAWEALPMVSSSALFDSIKDFLLEEKLQGRLLATADDLFHSLRRTKSNLADDELRANFEICIGRVESRGLIRRLHFGDLVLLQPELLDAYASAIVQAAKEEPDGLGFIPEEEALAGRFKLADSERVRDRAQEKLLLIATVEELLRHEIALKEVTDRGVDLVFPSQFTRERPDAPEIPGTRVTFSFEGPLYNIYATLAVRLSQSRLFNRQAMWQNVASYTAMTGGTCGIYLRELEEGHGELALFYDETADSTARGQFETYISEHLQVRALPGTVRRRQISVCSSCGYTLPNELVQRRLALGSTTIRCPVCEASVMSLLDEPLSPPGPAVAAMNRSADESRDRNVAATRLKGKIETADYDVFMCYNSKDKKDVMAIGERLKERGILPWLDVWDLPPGIRWQKELQRRLRSIKSAAVFIGPKGTGPWQDLEMQSLLQQLVRRNRPLIPVILEGRKGNPRFPVFLGLWQAVDMRQKRPDPFEQLVWGITGKRSSVG